MDFYPLALSEQFSSSVYYAMANAFILLPKYIQKKLIILANDGWFN